MSTVMQSYLENRSWVQPNHANSHDTAHGGHVMKWLDEIGAMSAMRHAGESCVTAQMGRIDFRRSIPVGNVILTRAYAYDAGETSVDVRLEAFREDPRTGETEPITDTRAVFVAVDDRGEPTEVPELTAETERGRELRAAALDDRE